MVCLRLAGDVWESVQVELQGQYSLQRFQALRAYRLRHPSRLRAIGVLLLTVMPCLVFHIGMDALPLVPPSEGLSKQTVVFWLRVFVVVWMLPFALTYQFCTVVPTLPMSTRRLWTISITVGIVMCLVALLLILAIDFPVPFANQAMTAPFLFVFGGALWSSWKNEPPEALASLRRYMWVYGSQLVMISTYSGFNVAFNALGGFHQTLLCGLLPFMKLFFKNCVSRAMYHHEDFSPTVITFTVDVFHALFLSLTMQKAASMGSNLVVMVVDAVQISIAYYEITRVLRRVQATGDMILTRSSRHVSPTTIGSIVPLSAFDYAVYLFETFPRVQHHPKIALPRYVRDHDHRKLDDLLITCWRRNPVTRRLQRRRPTVFPSAMSTATRTLNDEEQAASECAQSILKLMYMIEFYMLVEFAEVMLAVFYAVYIAVLSFLPNYVFYTQLSHLSSIQLRATAANVAIYAGSELLSFIVFGVMVDRTVKHFSSLQQLAFALETHQRFIQSIFLPWVYMIITLPLEHFGADYTFQFKWLHHANPAT